MDVLIKLLTFYALVLCTLSKETITHQDCQHQCLVNNTCHLKQFNKICYYLFNTDKTWKEGQELCKSHNLHMAKLPKEVQLHSLALEQLLRNRSDESWLGGNATNLKNWTFVNGVQLNGNYAVNVSRKHENDTTALNECGLIRKNQDSLIKCQCHKRHLFICRLSGWKGISEFFVSKFTATWFEARSWCKDHRGDLFHYNRGENFTEMTNQLDLGNYEYFIGVRRRVWRWADGDEIINFNWKVKEPSASKEMCMMIYSDGQWNDAQCSEKKHTICQKVSLAAIEEEPKDGDYQKCRSAYFRNTTVFIIIGLLGLTSLVIIILIVCIFNLRRSKSNLTMTDGNINTTQDGGNQMTDANQLGTSIDDISDVSEIMDNPIYG